MQGKLIIGVDPDSERHGIAIYEGGKLTKLVGLNAVELMLFLNADPDPARIEFHIENVCAQNQTFKKKGINNQAADKNVARSIGKCQQSQIELERMINHFGCKIVHHTISKNWKDKAGKKAFTHYTGWTGSSNEDTRSAAYFGWLGTQNGIQ